MTTRILVKNDVLKWAIKESQISADIIEAKIPQFPSWINGTKLPTLKQLQKTSNFLKIPLGYFLLQAPPEKDKFNIEYRTIGNKANKNISKNLKDTILSMSYKKDWMSEYRRVNMFDPISLSKNLDITNTQKFVQALYTELDIKNNWYIACKKEEDAFNFIRQQIENKGILVMLNGIVGNDTHRKLDINEFRAFVLKDDFSPLIFLNRNDSRPGIIFSLLHEFVHLLDKKEDNIFVDSNEHLASERHINSIVASFLAPEHILRQNISPSEDKIYAINYTANLLKTSTTVVAIRAHDLNLIDNTIKNTILEEAKNHFMHSRYKSKGGNYYATAQNRMSKNFYTSIVMQAESGRLPFTDAYRLLSLTGRTYNQFKDYINWNNYE